MGQVKQLETDIQYIMNVLSARGEQKAFESFENVLKMLRPETKVITHIHNGDSRELVVPCSNGMHGKDGAILIPVPEDELVNVHVCDFCGSDNVQTKAWVRPNNNNLYVDMASEEINDNYCDDCEENACLTVVEKNVRHDVIGFQVVGDSGTAEDGKVHPHMSNEKCVYSLDQANSMMDDDNNGDEQWTLLAVWTADIECPTILFEGDPRS